MDRHNVTYMVIKGYSVEEGRKERGWKEDMGVSWNEWNISRGPSRHDTEIPTTYVRTSMVAPHPTPIPESGTRAAHARGKGGMNRRALHNQHSFTSKLDHHFSESTAPFFFFGA